MMEARGLLNQNLKRYVQNVPPLISDSKQRTRGWSKRLRFSLHRSNQSTWWVLLAELCSQANRYFPRRGINWRSRSKEARIFCWRETISYRMIWLSRTLTTLVAHLQLRASRQRATRPMRARNGLPMCASCHSRRWGTESWDRRLNS